MQYFTQAGKLSVQGSTLRYTRIKQTLWREVLYRTFIIIFCIDIFYKKMGCLSNERWILAIVVFIRSDSVRFCGSRITHDL